MRDCETKFVRLVDYIHGRRAAASKLKGKVVQELVKYGVTEMCGREDVIRLEAVLSELDIILEEVEEIRG